MAQAYAQPYPSTGTSFPKPAPVPATDPFTGPFVCAQIPTAYMAVVLGALSQLLQPFAWRVDTDDARNQALDWMDTLIGIIASAVECAEAGMVSVTITAGTASGTASVTFPTAYSTSPVVVVSSDNGNLIASSESVTADGFTARLTANTEVPADVTANVSWQAQVAS